MRPTGKPCAKCVREMKTGCEHLANTYDRALLKGLTEQDLIEYACNRILALDRDNGNKAEGNPASRVYRSRNVRAAAAIANLCGHRHPTNAMLKCIRSPHPTEPDKHRY